MKKKSKTTIIILTLVVVIGMGFLIKNKHQEGFAPIPNWVKRLIGIPIVQPKLEEQEKPKPFRSWDKLKESDFLSQPGCPNKLNKEGAILDETLNPRDRPPLTQRVITEPCCSKVKNLVKSCPSLHGTALKGGELLETNMCYERQIGDSCYAAYNDLAQSNCIEKRLLLGGYLKTMKCEKPKGPPLNLRRKRYPR